MPKARLYDVFSLSSSIKAAVITIAVGSALVGCGALVGHPEHPQAAPAVYRLVHGDDLLIKEAKVEVLSLGESAMPALRSAMRSADPEGQARVLECAFAIGSPRDLLEKILRDGAMSDSVNVKVLVAKSGAALLAGPHSTVGRLDGTTVPDTFLKLIHDESPEVAITALRIVAGGPYKDIITDQDLDRLIRSPDPLIMVSAAALAADRGHSFPDNSRGEEQSRLVEYLSDPRPFVRATSCKALGSLGFRAISATPSLEALMSKDSHLVVRLQAALALVRIGTPSGTRAAIPVLRALSTHEDSSVRIAATAGLAQAEIRSAEYATVP